MATTKKKTHTPRPEKEAPAKPKRNPIELADQAVDDDKLEKACELLREATAKAKKRKSRREVQEAWEGHARHFMWQHEWAKAVPFFEGAVTCYRDGDKTEATAKILNDLGFCLQQVPRLEEAEAAVRRGLAMHTEAKRNDGIANSYYYLSGIVFERGRIDEAIEHSREAVKISRESGNKNDEAYHMYALARSLYEHGHTHEADQVCRAGIEITEMIGLEAVEANLLNMVANLALEDNNAVDARKFYKRARKMFKEQGLPNHAAITTANMGNLAWDCHQLDDALAAHEKALKAHKKANDDRSRAIVLTDRGGVFTELGRYDEAHACLEEALALNTQLGHQRRASFVRDAFAKLAEARGELEEARAHYAEAEMAFDLVGDKVAIGRMLLAMAGLQADIGDAASADALIARAEALDPSMLGGEPAPDAPPPRHGAAGARALRELALGRIEVARARFAPTAEATKLRDSATARLAAIEQAPDTLVERSSEVRRTAGRLRAALRRGVA